MNSSGGPDVKLAVSIPFENIVSNTHMFSEYEECILSTGIVLETSF